MNTTTAELLAAKGLAAEMKKELTDNILAYWMKKMCNPEGGFYGRISGPVCASGQYHDCTYSLDILIGIQSSWKS